MAAKKKPQQKVALRPMERQPVILSLMLLKDMWITEEQHPRFAGQWAPLWAALVAYRDSTPEVEWNQDLYNAILAGETGKQSKEWDNLNAVLNTIWALANTTEGEQE